MNKADYIEIQKDIFTEMSSLISRDIDIIIDNYVDYLEKTLKDTDSPNLENLHNSLETVFNAIQNKKHTLQVSETWVETFFNLSNIENTDKEDE